MKRENPYMVTYHFMTADVRVVETPRFIVAEVYAYGRMVHEIRTTRKGQEAALLALHDAKHSNAL